MGLVLGTLKRGETMWITYSNGSWGWGHAFGHANQPGWVLLQSNSGSPYVSYIGNKFDASLVPPHQELQNTRHMSYVSGSYKMPTWKESVAYSQYSFSATVKTGGATLYRNVNGNTPADPVTTLRAGTRVGVRFYPDRRYGWVMIQLKSNEPGGTGSAEWLFANVNKLTLRTPASWAFLYWYWDARNPCNPIYKIGITGCGG